ncbi:hypothetical protein AJ79_00335 [Helicocarpus griseus UAMH5409]|uniref:Uncharacterized protein n=1 Tax=Helicocarpus griseus UAMH5409 TaxID=1447875 RepID=A0A2B7YAJ7_9EURO|nr:hypothetical protein AJ79_00335 [Helicocarpus griseus UAMH5409]
MDVDAEERYSAFSKSEDQLATIPRNEDFDPGVGFRVTLQPQNLLTTTSECFYDIDARADELQSQDPSVLISQPRAPLASPSWSWHCSQD